MWRTIGTVCHSSSSPHAASTCTHYGGLHIVFPHLLSTVPQTSLGLSIHVRCHSLFTDSPQSTYRLSTFSPQAFQRLSTFAHCHTLPTGSPDLRTGFLPLGIAKVYPRLPSYNLHSHLPSYTLPHPPSHLPTSTQFDNFSGHNQQFLLGYKAFRGIFHFVDVKLTINTTRRYREIWCH